jgi:hypothetical protein
MRIFFSPNDKLLLMMDGFFGKRAYYFDPDYLTIYNQDETQEGGIRIRGEFNIIKPLKVILSSEYLRLEPFTIIYLTGGIRYTFGI